MRNGIKDRVVLITGGASGIGRVAAQLFGQKKARVIVSTDSNIEGGNETVNLIRESGGEATFIKCDVSKADQVEELIEKIIQIYGRLDYAFNNAGIGPDGKRVPIVSIQNFPEELWNRHIAINLTGVFLCIKYEMKQMLKQSYGSIVNTSSVGAYKAAPGFAAYNATKSGLLGLTKAAALEGAKNGVRVNAICPGPTAKTLLYDNVSSIKPGVKERMEKAVPLNRLAEPQEIAETVIWLCSDASSFVTGAILPVDGGMTAG